MHNIDVAFQLYFYLQILPLNFFPDVVDIYFPVQTKLRKERGGKRRKKKEPNKQQVEQYNKDHRKTVASKKFREPCNK